MWNDRITNIVVINPGELHELFKGYVIHAITSLRSNPEEVKEILVPPVKEEATATVMAISKAAGKIPTAFSL